MGALQNAIKTEYTLYAGVEDEFGQVSELQPMRKSDCTLEGTVEQIASDVKLPNTRVQATPETGAESNAGDLNTEWNIDEQDDLFSAVMCEDWNGNTLTMGNKTKTFSFLKKYTQAPVEYQWFKKVHVNQLQIAMELNSFVKLTWGLMGSNHPIKETELPAELTSVTPNAAMTTKSFKTLQGYIKIGDEYGSNMVPLRQVSSLNLTINNNLETTNALCETEAIEQSLGDFQVTGSMNVLNSGDISRTLYNEAVRGCEKTIEIRVEREDITPTQGYTIRLRVHLDKVGESKNGNKLENAIDFTMVGANGIIITKEQGKSEDAPPEQPQETDPATEEEP